MIVWRAGGLLLLLLLVEGREGWGTPVVAHVRERAHLCECARV